VAAAAHGDSQVGVDRVRKRSEHLLLRSRTRDRCRPPVDHAVEGKARLVERLVGWEDQWQPLRHPTHSRRGCYL